MARMIEYATGGLRPDLTVFLDLPPWEGLRRNRSQGDGKWNRLDAQELSFHQRVVAGYRKLIAREPQRWVEIDASQPREQVHQDVVRAVEKRLAVFAHAP